MNVPNGDLLLHAGDLTFRGDISEISQELKELGRISKGFKYGCVLVPGNHDFLAERDPSLMKQMCIDNGITYLQHERTEINGLKIFGSGYTPFFHNWALNVERGPKLAALWGQIPDDTEILITHGPAMGCLDWVVTPNGYESVFRHGEDVKALQIYPLFLPLSNLTLSPRNMGFIGPDILLCFIMQ